MELLDRYEAGSHYDEVFDSAGQVRKHYREIFRRLEGFDARELKRRENLKDSLFRTQGITFTVYGESEETERTFPLDLLPRIIPGHEWQPLESGLEQRISALNLFLEDIYGGDQVIIKDKVIPRQLVESAEGYVPQAVGIPAPHAARCLISGIDLIRDGNGEYLVLEDNLRSPSGVSYVIENRSAMTRVLPRAFEKAMVRPVSHYPTMLLEALQSVSPRSGGDKPRVVLLTPGRFNSAYYEHSCLARLMGITLVEATNLVTQDEHVYMRTTKGLQRVDVIYRRVDDDFLDPDVFRPDSVLGVPGLVNAARKRNVTICNALGNGVADDKAVYAYVPAMIEYYLGERPILNNVKTYLLDDPEQREAVLKRLDQLVVKPVSGSGGYGLVFGPTASAKELEDCRLSILSDPRNFIAQEVVTFSKHPTLIDSSFHGRHVDLRPFVVTGDRVEVLPGGLTRVALPEGSLIVNSSQGGGSKDTWVTASGPNQRTVQATTEPAQLGDAHQDLILTSTGQDLYWIGRYLERSKNTAHLLDVIYHSVLEEDPDLVGVMLRGLLNSLALEKEYEETGLAYDSESVVHFLVSDLQNPGSIRSAIGTARRNMRQAQEKVSIECWEGLNDLYFQLNNDDLSAQLADHPFELFSDIWRKCAMVSGVMDETMSHNDAWRFTEVGRQTERALLTSRMLAVFLPRMQSEDQDMAFHGWITALRSAGAIQEYRKLFQSSLDPLHAAMFLIQNREFPRSIQYCIRQCDEALDDLGTRLDSSGKTDLTEPARQRIKQLRSLVENADLRSVETPTPLSLVYQLSIDLELFNDELYDGFFEAEES